MEQGPAPFILSAQLLDDALGYRANNRSRRGSHRIDERRQLVVVRECFFDFPLHPLPVSRDRTGMASKQTGQVLLRDSVKAGHLPGQQLVAIGHRSEQVQELSDDQVDTPSPQVIILGQLLG